MLPNARKVEQAQLGRVAALQGTEVISAVYDQHAFAPHVHDTFVIELVESGCDEFLCNGKRFLAEPGDLIIFNPGDVHTGRPHGSRLLSYRSIYPSVELLSQQLALLNCSELRPGLRFQAPVVRDRDLAMSFRIAHQACEANANEAGELFSDFVAKAGRLLNPGGQFEEVKFDQRLVQARELLSSRLEQRISWDEIALAVRLSPFHLARQFRHAFGLAPHQFRLSARVAECRRLLRTGMTMAEVALAAGFADQSHLSRNFKRIVGMTPGTFRQGLPTVN